MDSKYGKQFSKSRNLYQRSSSIITTEDLNTELGISSYGMRDVPYNASPVDRLSIYGPRIAFVNEILPDRSDIGRQDPLAKAGRALNKKSNKRKAQDAQERLDKGERKDKGKRRLFKSYDDIEWVSNYYGCDMSRRLLTFSFSLC
jgi:hypothetical protein